MASRTANCQWQCQKNTFQDRASRTCPTCLVPCSIPGQYRPFCGTADTRLPQCVSCANRPTGAPATVTATIHFRYTASVMQQEAEDPRAIACPY
eukprot:103461-Rhodomonas_salina.1